MEQAKIERCLANDMGKGGWLELGVHDWITRRLRWIYWYLFLIGDPANMSP